MPNVFKSGNTATNGSIYKGQFTIGVNTNVDFGPTSATSFWNGVVPASGGYTIYQNKAANGPSIRTAANDSALVTTMLSLGSTGHTAAQVLNWASQQSNIMVANRDYESIVTSGMVLCLDAGYVSSYPTTANAWTDLSGNATGGSLTNGPTFTSNYGGGIVFDGTNDYVPLSNTTLLSTQSITIQIWFLPTSTGGMIIRNRAFGWKIETSNGNIITSVHPTSNVANEITVSTGVSYVPLNVPANACMTFGNSTLSLYVNGVFYNSASAVANTIYYVTRAISLGRDGDFAGSYLNGTIYSAQIYNRALSATEVSQNYNAQKGRFGL